MYDQNNDNIHSSWKLQRPTYNVLNYETEAYIKLNSCSLFDHGRACTGLPGCYGMNSLLLVRLMLSLFCMHRNQIVNTGLTDILFYVKFHKVRPSNARLCPLYLGRCATGTRPAKLPGTLAPETCVACAGPT